MVGLIDLIGKADASIEIGQIISGKGDNSYIVIIGGIEYPAFSAINTPLRDGHKVVVLKTGIGKRYITGFLGVIGKQGSIKEIIKNG